jgi:branched-chain amino acid aminotransferase
MEIHPQVKEKIQAFTFDATTPLGFGKIMSPIMISCTYKDNAWGPLKLLPYGPISLDPCTKVLHYAQEIFEGLKAFRQPDDKLAIFRPELNAQRFNFSARRMSMPTVDESMFIEACATLTAYSEKLVPKRLGESLYLRPFMIATEVGLGIKPANEFLFMIVASPSGNYFSGNAVKVYIERDDIRAAMGGTGAAKTGGNYSASLHSYTKTIELGCDQTMWLDAIHHQYVEEMSGMNFMAIYDRTLVTPSLSETILDGHTRKSILEIAKDMKLEKKEVRIDINQLLKDIKSGACTEAFVCGTASVVVPISHFLDKSGEWYEVRHNQGKVSLEIREHLINLQSGRLKAPDRWLYPVKKVEI